MCIATTERRGPKPTIPHSDVDIIVERLKSESFESIALSYGLTHTAVRSFMQRRGFSTKRPAFVKYPADAIAQAIIAGGQVREVAKTFSCKYDTVRRICNARGLPLNTNRREAGRKSKEKAKRLAICEVCGVDCEVLPPYKRAFCRGCADKRRRAERNRLTDLRRRKLVRLHTPEEWEQLLKDCGGICVYCRFREATTKDHYIAVAKGGTDDISNIRPACMICNQYKGDLSPDDWFDKMWEHLS